MKKKCIKFLFFILVTMQSINFASTKVEHVNEYGFTPKQNKIFLNAMSEYMFGLNKTCRHSTLTEGFHSLPEQYFEIKGEYNSEVCLKKDISLSAALDSLLADPKGDKHMLLHDTAMCFSYLQGIRAVLNNDDFLTLLLKY